MNWEAYDFGHYTLTVLRRIPQREFQMVEEEGFPVHELDWAVELQFRAAWQSCVSRPKGATHNALVALFTGLDHLCRTGTGGAGFVSHAGELHLSFESLGGGRVNITTHIHGLQNEDYCDTMRINSILNIGTLNHTRVKQLLERLNIQE